MARWLEYRSSNPMTLALILWRGRVSDSFFSRADLFVPGMTPRSRVRHARIQMSAHVKDPISICRKTVGLDHSRWYGRSHTKILRTLKLVTIIKGWVARLSRSWLSSGGWGGGTTRISPWGKIPFGTTKFPHTHKTKHKIEIITVTPCF